MLLNNKWLINEIKEELKSTWKPMKINPKLTGHSESSPEREVYSITGITQEHRKILSKQCNSTLKRTKKTKTNKAQME